MQDHNVLDDQDGEVLENVGLQDTFKQRLQARRKQKLLQHVNSKLMPVDEDEWAEPKGVLSKYDDEAEIAHERKARSRIKIGEVV